MLQAGSPTIPDKSTTALEFFINFITLLKLYVSNLKNLYFLFFKNFDNDFSPNFKLSIQTTS